MMIIFYQRVFPCMWYAIEQKSTCIISVRYWDELDWVAVLIRLNFSLDNTYSYVVTFKGYWEAVQSLSLHSQKIVDEPWLVWLSGLSTGLGTKGLRVQFPVRAYVWVAGQLPSRVHMRGNHTFIFLSHSFSLPSPASNNK